MKITIWKVLQVFSRNFPPVKMNVFIKGDHKRMLGVFNQMRYVIKVVYD